MIQSKKLASTHNHKLFEVLYFRKEWNCLKVFHHNSMVIYSIPMTQLLIEYCMVPLFKGYKFCEWIKKGSLRKQFSQIYIGDAHIVRSLFWHWGIIAFSISAQHKNSIWPIVQLSYLPLLFKIHWDMTNLWKIWFCVMSNSGMPIPRSFYMLTTYQCSKSGWHVNGLAICEAILTIARDWVIAIYK